MRRPGFLGDLSDTWFGGLGRLGRFRPPDGGKTFIDTFMTPREGTYNVLDNLPPHVRANPEAVKLFQECITGKNWEKTIKEATTRQIVVGDGERSRGVLECVTKAEHFFKQGQLPPHLKDGEPYVEYHNCLQVRGPSSQDSCKQEAERIYHRGNGVHQNAAERYAKGWPVKRGVWPDIPGNME